MRAPAEPAHARRNATRACPGRGAELDVSGDVRVVVCLGAFAWDAALRLRVLRGLPVPRPRPRFGHGASFGDGGPLPLLGCFHPSQQNTFTGRLTASMLDDVLLAARERAAPASSISPDAA